MYIYVCVYVVAVGYIHIVDNTYTYVCVHVSGRESGLQCSGGVIRCVKSACMFIALHGSMDLKS